MASVLALSVADLGGGVLRVPWNPSFCQDA